MSKKLLHSRLDDLFTQLDSQDFSLPTPADGVAESLPAWNWETDGEGKYTCVGQEVGACLGYRPDRWLGQPACEFAVAEADQDRILAAFEQPIFPAEINVYFQSAEGTFLPVRLTILSRSEQNGHGPGFRGMAQVLSAPLPVEPSTEAKLTKRAARTPRPVKPRVDETAPAKQLTGQLHGLAVRSHTEQPQGLSSVAAKTLEARQVVAEPKRDTQPAVIAAPIQLREGGLGFLELVANDDKQRWSEDERLLVQEVANQLGLALENAQLYAAVQTELSERVKAEEEVRKALKALEVRERYQANVARAVATLTEKGFRSLPEVLNLLTEAAQANRVTFARARIDAGQPVWTEIAGGREMHTQALSTAQRARSLPILAFQRLAEQLKTPGWVTVREGHTGDEECHLLNLRAARSVLLLAVPGKGMAPNFLAFDQLDAAREWRQEEINVLRVAADAIANTLVREDLLGQLQSSLEESENLYASSHNLSLANEIGEMVKVVVEGVKIKSINRAALLLFRRTSEGEIRRIEVAANWYGGMGTEPDPIGAEYDCEVCLAMLRGDSPTFLADTTEGDFPAEIREQFKRQHIQSMAILPLWSGKLQLGVLLLQSDERHKFTAKEIRMLSPLADQLSTALDNRQLYLQTEESLAETQLLYKITAAIAEASTIEDLVKIVSEYALPQNAQRISLQMVTHNTQGHPEWLEVVGFLDRSGKYRNLGLRNPFANFPFLQNLTGGPVVIRDVDATPIDPLSRENLKRFAIVSGCLTPLFSGGKLIGILGASSDVPAEYAEDEVRLFHVTANGIAVALERQLLFAESQRRALELETAAEIARDTSSTLALDMLLKRMVNLIRERFNFYHASIFLMDDTNEYAVIRESTGQAGEDMKKRGHRLAVGSRSVIGRATATGEPYVVNDVNQYAYYYPNPLLPKTRSELGLPLKMGNRVIGALDIQSNEPNAFSESEVAVLRVLADQIAVAIENARAYELAQKAVEEMREVDRLKSQFLANMSHELRTPLNSIIGFSRVILKGIDGPINEIQEQDLSSIYNSGQHLLSLINNILDLSKIEAGKMELQFSDVNLSDIINSVMSTAVGLVKDKPIKLYSNVPADLPVVVADQTRVRQVLLNFLSNASKFTEKGSITVDAGLTHSPTNIPEVLISVTDTGEGIAEEDRYKLFQPFSQVDDSPTRKTGGTGLGLSICRSFIELHGGRIGLSWSEIGKGSTFYFTLPLRHEEPQAATDGLPEADVPNENRVLSVDDDLQVIELYQRYLKPLGYQVIPLTNPHLTVQQAKEIKPLAITLDLMMPEQDGWSVLQALKNDPETRNIPVIICSIQEQEEKGFSLGAADYLVKPFLQEDLIQAVSRLNRDGKLRDLLLVDDSPEDLRLLQKTLEEQGGYRVWTAEGGQAALKSLQTLRPDAIFLDLFMPDMDGFSLLETFRTDPLLRNVPVIILTGADLTAEQRDLLSEFGQQMIHKGSLREIDLLNTLENSLRALRTDIPAKKA